MAISAVSLRTFERDVSPQTPPKLWQFLLARPYVCSRFGRSGTVVLVSLILTM